MQNYCGIGYFSILDILFHNSSYLLKHFIAIVAIDSIEYIQALIKAIL